MVSYGACHSVQAKSVEVKKLVYMYLVHYAVGDFHFSSFQGSVG